MLTFGDLIGRFRSYTGVAASSTGETLGKSLTNQAHHMLVQAGDFDFPEKTHDITTAASTFQYDLPPWYGTMKEVLYIDGTDQEAPMKEVTSWDMWYRLRSNTYSTTIPSHYWVVKDSVGHSGQQVWLYPTPDTASKTIRTVFTRRVKEMTAADYTTGTVTVVNDDATVTGTSTVFTAAMVDRAIQLPDGYWYDIASRTSDTVIEIAQNYPSATDATGTAFQLGEIPIVPEEYQDALWQYSVGTWWKSERQYEDSAFYLGLFRETLDELKAGSQSKTTGAILTDNDDLAHRHKNDYPDAV